MTTAILLVALLLAIVAVACLMVWDLNATSDRLIRRADVLDARRARLSEDISWTLREFEYATAIELTLARLNVRTADDLASRLGLEGVA